jgi:hypothetical protein
MIDTEFEENFLQLQKGELESWQARAKARHIGDQAAYDAASQRFSAFAHESETALKAEGLKFEAELRLDPTADDDTMVAQLLVAFQRGSRLSRIWDDLMHQVKISACCAKKISKNILPALEGMDRLGELEQFLDHPDLAVRARAASWLLDRMPDRCLPILREIDRTERALDAGWIACWALDAHERRTGVKSA